jgi:RimJ/RimL family protein N-acetyltransferase
VIVLRPIAREVAAALLARLRAGKGLQQITAETLAVHGASRRVLEKAGTRLCDERLSEVGAELVEPAVYEAA